MKDYIPESPNDSTSRGSAPLESVNRRKRRATLFASLLSSGILLGSFLILFAAHRPGVDRSNQTIPSTTSTAPDSWPGSAIFGVADSTLYTPGSLHYLFALRMQDGRLVHLYQSQKTSADKATVTAVPNDSQSQYLWNTQYASVDRIAVYNGIIYTLLWNYDTSSQNPDAHGVVEAWQPSDGKILWQYPFRYSETANSLIVVNGTVYISTSLGAIYALQASNGALKWGYHTDMNPNYQSAYLTLADGTIFVSSTTNFQESIYALEASSGKFLWKSTLAAGDLANWAPVASGGIVYVDTVFARVFYALEARTGKVLWHTTLDDTAQGPPGVSNGVVYVGTQANSVYALRATTGAILWHQRTDHFSVPLPVASPNRTYGVYIGTGDATTLYVGSDDGYLCALRRSDGSFLWLTQTTGLRILPAFVREGVLYVSADDGYTNASAVYALRAKDGSRIWRAPIGLLNPTMPAPTPTSLKDAWIPITKADMTAYTEIMRALNIHPVSISQGNPGIIVKTKEGAIAKISVITDKDLRGPLGGEDAGLPDNALVCLVEIQGPLPPGISVTYTGPPPTKPITPVVPTQALFVLDAQTGNILVEG